MNWIPLVESHLLPAVCGLYLIRHRDSGREYVGKSVNVRQRAAHHRRANSGVTYLYKAIRKHGVAAFDICLYATGTEEEMTLLEVEVIAARGTFNPAGYNQTRGGDGVSGYRYTAAQRAAVTARQLGRPNPPEAIEKMRTWALKNNPFRGRKHSPETLEKVAEASRRLAATRTISPETRKKMADSKRGKPLPPHTEEAKQKISQALKGRPKPAGFAERYYAGKNNPMYGRRGGAHPRARQVLVWVPNSLTPMTFNSVEEAAKWVGATAASVCDWCVDRYKPKNGFSWARL